MTRGILLFALCGLTAGDAAAQMPQVEKTGTIRGRITAADTGRPLRRARVTIALPSAGSPPLIANTNSLGQFEAKNIPPGSYVVSASRAGYLEAQYGQRRPAGRGATVDVQPGQTIEGIDIALPRGGVLTGRITDELGEPYPGVQVQALTLRYRLGKRVQTTGGIAITDDAGQFRIAGLPPGSYSVVASSTETWRNEKKEPLGYASTFYPGVTPDLAEVITLRVSQHRGDLNFSLHSGRAVRVSGRIVREDGLPAASAGVTIAYSYPGAGSILTYGMRSVRTGADGSFEIKDVPGGSYSVMSGGDERHIMVAGADIDDVILTSRTGSIITGTVVTEDRVPPPFPSSGVLITADAPFGKVLPRSGAVAVESDWSFTYTLGGPFLFRVLGLPENWSLRAVRLGDKDITDTPWDVPTGGKKIGGLTIVLGPTTTRVSGTVSNDSGKPAAAATVIVFTEDADRWIPYSRLVRVIRTTAEGRFSLAGLPPGTYRAVAVEAIEEGQWEDRAFLESLRDAAARVVLADGGTESLTLKLSDAR